MARKGYGRNSTLVNITTHADDGTSPVGSNEWNENPNTDGVLGLTKSTQAISSNDIDVTDSYIEVSNAGDIYTLSAVTTSLSSTNYASDSASSISEGDLIYIVKAAGVGTVNLKHQNGGAGAGKITTLTAGDKALSATVPTILMARTISSALEWVEYGGGAVADGSITSAKIANDSIINEDINSSANIALSKLASDPLARANHTGTQAASTIVDFDTEVANNTAVTANTAKISYSTAASNAVAANTAKTGITSGQASAITANAGLLAATAGTVTASKALIVDASKDLTGINNLTVAGDLTVNGTNTIINSTTLTVDDKNIEMGSVATPTDTTADGGGITLKGATDKTILWDDTNDNWTSSEHVNIATGKAFKVNNVDTLTATALGTNVVGSSLTSVGTLTGLSLTGALSGTDVELSGRLKTDKGADVASATAMTLGADGNAFDITGTTTIVTIPSTNWSAGNLIHLQFDGVLTVTHSSAADSILLGDQANMTTAAGDVLSLFFNGTNWVEVSRSSVSSGGGGAHVTQEWTATTAPSNPSTGTGIMYMKTIDSNNEGLFMKMRKNGQTEEVQIA